MYFRFTACRDQKIVVGILHVLKWEHLTSDSEKTFLSVVGTEMQEMRHS